MEKLELKHLAPYLPYGLNMVRISGLDGRIVNTTELNTVFLHEQRWDKIWKPILRPLSEKTLREIFKNFSRLEINIKKHSIKIKYNLLGDIFETWIKTSGNFSNCPKWIIDLFNENHVDYNGLIEKGLAVSIHDIKTK